MGRRDPERMEADAAAGPLVPQRQFWADAILLAHLGAADQSPPGGLADAGLRRSLIRGVAGRKTSRSMQGEHTPRSGFATCAPRLQDLKCRGRSSVFLRRARQ